MLQRILPILMLASAFGMLESVAQTGDACSASWRTKAYDNFNLCLESPEASEFKQKACESARTDYSLMLRFCDDEAYPLSFRARVHFELGQMDLALADIDRAIAVESPFLDQEQLLALQADIRQQLDFEKGRSKLLTANDLIRNGGDLAEAERLIDEALALGVGDQKELAMRLRANLLNQSQDWAQARAQIDDLIAYLAPQQDGEIWKVRGDLSLRLEYPADAESDYTRALEAGLNETDQIHVFEQRSRIRFQTYDFDGAIDDLTRLIALRESWGAYALRGEVYFQQAKLAHADNDVSAAIRLFDGRESDQLVALHQRKARILKAKDDVSGALDAYGEALAIAATPTLQLERGEYLFLNRLYEAALADFEAVLTEPSATPDDLGQAHLRRGLIRHEWQEAEAALAAYRAFFYNAGSGDNATLQAIGRGMIATLQSNGYYDGNLSAWDEAIETALVNCVQDPNCKF